MNENAPEAEDLVAVQRRAPLVLTDDYIKKLIFHLIDDEEYAVSGVAQESFAFWIITEPTLSHLQLQNAQVRTQVDAVLLRLVKLGVIRQYSCDNSSGTSVLFCTRAR